MANKKISDLTAASAVADANQFEINESGTSKRVTAAQIKTYVGGGTTTVATISALEALTSSEGDMVFVTGTNGLFIKKTAGWYKIATVANDQLESVTVTMSGGGTAGDPYLLALDGTDTTATGAATDPEGLSVTWSAAAISPATLSGNNIVVSSTNVATITQGTGASSNVFTIDPVATTGTHNFSLRFSVTDGINATINTDKNYTLNFVTSVDNSKYTTLLAQAVGSGTNSSFDDASSNNHTITAVGNTTAGTFSPYRSGGYSAYGHFRPEATSGTLDTYSLSFWYKLNSVVNAGYLFETQSSSFSMRGETASGGRFEIGGALYIQNDGSGNNYADNNWHYFVVSRTPSATSWYIDGSQITTDMWGGSVTLTLGSLSAQAVRNMTFGGRDATSDLGALATTNRADIEFRDIELKSTTHNGTVPTEPVTSSSDTVFLTAHKPYGGYDYGATPTSALIETLGTNFETRATSPYDYSEYSAADHGGSFYFDGSGDSLQAYHASGLRLGTSSAFTLEFYFYPNGTSSDYQALFSTYSGSSASDAGQSARLIFNTSNNLFILTDGSSNFLQVTKAVPQKTWNHFCWTRDASNNHKFYLNGEQIGTSTTSTNFQTDLWYFGRRQFNGDQEFTGHMSDISLTNSVTRTSAFAPPTSPLSSSGTTLHLKCTDASILDKAQSNNFELSNNISPTSVLTSSTTPAYIGANWANERAISFGNSSGNSARTKSFLPINQGSYTVEGWINLNSGSGTHTFFDTRLFDPSTNSNAGFYMMWRTDSGNYFRVGSGDGVYLDNIGSGDSLSTGTWYHFALVRDASQSSNNTAFFIDGIRKSQMQDTRNKTSDQATIGSNYSNSSIMGGYLQDFRVSHKARYNVTSSDVSSSIPTAPLEA